MPEHFSDRLLKAVERTGSPVCVGIDPVLERLPDSVAPHDDDALEASAALMEFSCRVISAVAEFVPAVKIQAACFERYRAEGVAMMYDVVHHAHEAGLIVILDAKRGDIGITAEHYADGFFNPLGLDPLQTRDDFELDAGELELIDAVTIHSYLGADGIEPFCRNGRGAFALVRTSNPAGDLLQAAKLESGRTVAQHVAAMVADLGRACMGTQGYSNLGAVVGATKRAEAADLRALMPDTLFLVPGYGAQGAGPDDIGDCFNSDGRGALITASRSIIYAFDDDQREWESDVAAAARQFAREVRQAIA